MSDFMNRWTHIARNLVAVSAVASLFLIGDPAPVGGQVTADFGLSPILSADLMAASVEEISAPSFPEALADAICSDSASSPDGECEEVKFRYTVDESGETVAEACDLTDQDDDHYDVSIGFSFFGFELSAEITVVRTTCEYGVCGFTTTHTSIE